MERSAGICQSRQGGAHHVDLSPTLASENYFVSSFDETEGRKLRCKAYARGAGRPWAPPLTQYKPRRFQACKPWTMASPIASSVGGVGLGLFLVPFPVVRPLGFGVDPTMLNCMRLLHALRNVSWGFVAELWQRLSGQATVARIAYSGTVLVK